MYCSNCGAEVNDNAVVCVKCGCALNKTSENKPSYDPNKSDKEWSVALLLCFFLGGWGIHSFYAGKTTNGILQLLTGGGCGLWWLYDFIMIIIGKYTDSEGKVISNK